MLEATVKEYNWMLPPLLSEGAYTVILSLPAAWKDFHNLERPILNRAIIAGLISLD